MLFLNLLIGCEKQTIKIDPITDTSFKEVKPIFESKCIKCHSGHQDWSNYDKAFKARFRIKERVYVLKTMPPNKNDLQDLDRNKIRNWVDSGAKP